jgi:hypothetical protein
MRMMSRAKPLYQLLALAAWIFAMPVPAAAQCRLCDTPATSRSAENEDAPISLDIETKLDFDRLILLGQGEGLATLLPNGTRSVSGIISEMSGRAMVGSAVVRGEAGRTIRVDLPQRIDLYSLSGGRISLEDVVSDLSAAPKLDGSGSLYFRFGGRLRISGDADGEYRGDVPITVEYM